MNAVRPDQSAQVDLRRPWLKFYDCAVPHSLDYPAVTLYGALAASAENQPESVAWEFEGSRHSYAQLMAEIDSCAGALAGLGLQAGDRLLVVMPTTPHAVVVLYAAARLGVVSAFVHPLSTAAELGHYLDTTGAQVALTLDAFYPNLAAASPRRPLTKIILGRIQDYLSPWKGLLFGLTQRRRIAPIPMDPRVSDWGDWPVSAVPPPMVESDPDCTAVILFSGGTTDLPKGILLSHRAIIAQGLQAAAWGKIGAGYSMLAILPVFHGFGLGVCINAVLMAGGRTLLVPRFDAALVAKLIRRKRPNVLVGVPTLYQALAADPGLVGVDFRFLRAAFCGADSLPRTTKDAFEARVSAGGGKVRLLEGYGLTETVTGIMAMPREHYREGSIGLPFPDMQAKICTVGSTELVPDGEEGEICIAGPTLMNGYLDAPEATAQALRRHSDGQVWLHTGDIGRRDSDGYFYFCARQKRIIKSSGYNVYPAQVEALLQQHPALTSVCVIGIPDDRQVERVVAVVVPKDFDTADERLALELIDYCQQSLIKWSCPRQICFQRQLPTTKVGKIDYRRLSSEYTQ